MKRSLLSVLLIALSASLWAKVEVVVDCTKSPSSKEWGAKAKTLVESWYPKLTKMLAQKGWTPPEKVTLVFQPQEGVAGTAGDTIYISEKWIQEHPDDWGMVVHELIHVVQSYKVRTEGWITEGIADGIRYGKFEPEKNSTLHDPTRSTYKDGYWSAGAFLTWVEKKYDKNLFTRLNLAARTGTYKPEFWNRYKGKSFEQLWEDYKAWYAEVKAKNGGKQPRLSDITGKQPVSSDANKG